MEKAHAQPTSEPPQVGRPENFSNLVGAYRLASSAAPAEVCVEDPLTLTVRISGQGPKEYQPRREHLRLFPGDFSQHFFVEEVPGKDRHLPAENAWEFVWRLRPKHQHIKEIPALELVYFRFPKYQTSLTPPIPLAVKPRPEVQLEPEVVAASGLPDRFYQWRVGPERLPQLRAAPFPGPVLLFVLAAVPPVLCTSWYLLWRRFGVPETAVRRRSQAARSALAALQKPGPAAGVVHMVGVMDEYLRQRFDFPTAEPTPTEAARHLFRLGAPRPLQQRLAGFFQACDAARFAPERGPDRLADEAVQLILDLEADPCVSRFAG